MPTRQVVNSSAYCQERRFSSSCSFSRHSLSRPFVWKKVSDNKEDSSDESSSQKIPSNWFPEITLCGNNLWKSTQRGVCVCMCVRRAHEKKKKKTLPLLGWGWEREIAVSIRETDGTMRNLQFKEILFFFFRLHAKTRKEIPGSCARQTARDPVWGRKKKEVLKPEIAHKTLKWLHIAIWNLMRNCVRIEETLFSVTACEGEWAPPPPVYT